MYKLSMYKVGIIKMVQRLLPAPWPEGTMGTMEESGGTYIHIYIHTYIHTYIHIHTYIYIHTYTYIHIHTYTHTSVYVYIERERESIHHILP